MRRSTKSCGRARGRRDKGQVGGEEKGIRLQFKSRSALGQDSDIHRLCGRRTYLMRRHRTEETASSLVLELLPPLLDHFSLFLGRLLVLPSPLKTLQCHAYKVRVSKPSDQHFHPLGTLFRRAQTATKVADAPLPASTCSVRAFGCCTRPQTSSTGSHRGTA